MNFDKILELYEAGQLKIYSARNQRIDNCPTHEVVRDLPDNKREERIREKMREQE